MPRVFEEFYEVPDHGKVGYTLRKRGKYYRVLFDGPKGDYERISTGMTRENEARIEAGRIILRTYRPQQRFEPVTWEEMLQKLQSAMTINGSRPVTYLNYASTLRLIRSMFPQTDGPQDIGPDEAQRFKDEYLSNGFKRGKDRDAKLYRRSLNTFNTYLRSARAIWGKWLKQELKLVAENPWQSVTFVKVDRKPPEAPDEDVLLEFFQFVKTRCPNWELPILFLQTKCLLGCRMMDLCSVRSDQLKNGVLELDPEQLKARDFRRVELPKDLYRALNELKGESFLWEHFPEQYRACLRAQGLNRVAARIRSPFTPAALYVFILGLFDRFQTTTGKKLRSHMLRKRAITLLVMEKVPVEIAARMLGMDVQTLRRYYLDMDKVASGKKFTEFADKLIPRV